MGHRTTKLKDETKVHKTIESRTDFFYYAFRNILLISLPLTLISALILSLPHSSAYSSSTDNVSLTLPSSCTISATIVSNHSASLVNGQKEDDIGNTKINAHCNDTNGYFIYAIGTSGDTDGNTDLIFNNGVNDNYNIHTGIYNTSSTNSSWAMKLSSNSGPYAPTIMSGYDSYSEIPSTDTIVAYKTSGTSMDPNTDATGSYFNTTYQIYANTLQPAGTYLGKVKYTMTHPYDSSSLPNMENAFDIAGKDKITVTDPVTGITGSYYKMQDMSERICNLTKVYGELSATQLVDIRDNRVYWVAKLNDNNCWMTQNLDLDLSSSVALTSETSDIDPDTYGHDIYTSAAGYSQNGNVVSWTPSTIDSGNVQRADTIVMDGNTASGWTNNNNNPYSADAGDRYRYTNTSGNESIYTSLSACLTGTNNDEIGCKHAHLGNYYNWSAAVASNNTNGASNSQTNSICPKNWNLPINGEYGTMLDAQDVWTGSGSTYDTDGYLKIRTSPLYFVRSGGVGGGMLNGFGSYGVYLSSTVFNSSIPYVISFSASNVNPANYDNRSYGFPVRCMVSSSN